MKRLPVVDPSAAPVATSTQYHKRPRTPRPSSKQIGYMVLAIAVCVLLVWVFRPAPIRVTLGNVNRGTLQVTIDAEGKTRVRDRFTIAAPVNGHLGRISLTEGDEVQSGDRVAQIDPLPLTTSVQEALGRLAEWRAQRAGVATQRPKAETLAQARTRIQAAQADQRQAEARVAQAQAALTQARRDRQRAQQLAASGAIAQQEREAAELNEITKTRELEATGLAANAAAAEVEAAKAALVVLQREQTDPDYLLNVYDARIASTEAELAKLRDDANRTDIRSPVQGRVLRVLQKSAQFVSEGTALMELGDVSNLELVIDVLSTDAEQIKPGNPILIERLDGPALRATVHRVEPAAFTKVSALGVEEQRVNVIGDFGDRPLPFGDAYRVEAKIVIWEGQNVLKVPVSALFRCNQDWCVFTVNKNRALQRQVKVAHRSAFEAEIQHGLTQGDVVILHPNEQIDNDTTVRSR